MVLLDYSSKAIKDPKDERCIEDLRLMFTEMSPQFVYTHNLTDKHDTHVATALRVIEALRRIPATDRPKKLFGCEVWRSLDWLLDSIRSPSTSARTKIYRRHCWVYMTSQIWWWKRYDLASMGRRKANATYFETHGLDTATGLAFGMDLTHLIEDDKKPINNFVQEYISRFAQAVADSLYRLG